MDKATNRATGLHAPANNHQEPTWLQAWRQQHATLFQKNGFPSPKNEQWKYADLTALQSQSFADSGALRIEEITPFLNQYRLKNKTGILMVSVNGCFIPALSDIHLLPRGLTLCTWQEAAAEHGDLLQHAVLNASIQAFPFAVLNTMQRSEGLFVHVPAGMQFATPIHLLSITQANASLAVHPQRIVILGAGSQLTLVEEYSALEDAAYFLNVVNQVYVGEAASLQYIKLQQESHAAWHIGTTLVEQEATSQTNFINFANGAHFARDDLHIKLLGADAQSRTGGFYKTQHPNQYIDHHIEIVHVGKRSQSDMLFKGILDKSARAVFNGRLLVTQSTEKINAHQANHNLLLCHGAEVYSKPELEIYAEDVKCKHGASTGQIDLEAIFYLCSRGIPKEMAMQMLLSGFAEEVLQRIPHASIAERVQEALQCQS